MSVNVCRPSRRGRGTRRLSVEPNIKNVVYMRFWNNNPNPNVATARYTPERRKLGTDTNAPTATARPRTHRPPPQLPPTRRRHRQDPRHTRVLQVREDRRPDRRERHLPH